VSPLAHHGGTKEDERRAVSKAHARTGSPQAPRGRQIVIRGGHRGSAAPRGLRADLSPLKEPVRGHDADDAKRSKELERENAVLKYIVADQDRDIAMLKEVAKGSSEPGTPPPCGGDALGALRSLGTSRTQEGPGELRGRDFGHRRHQAAGHPPCHQLPVPDHQLKTPELLNITDEFPNEARPSRLCPERVHRCLFPQLHRIWFRPSPFSIFGIDPSTDGN
jgi:hypothetical protein